MSEILNVEATQEENFAELLEQSIKTLNTGDKVIGVVTGKSSRDGLCWNHGWCVHTGVDYKGGQQDYERNYQC